MLSLSPKLHYYYYRKIFQIVFLILMATAKLGKIVRRMGVVYLFMPIRLQLNILA